ncbi:acetyltransferase [Salipaludibacillus agaradhaerens]|uniref:Acetyltransferase n=1 Tax=Salipaludibacillus agaradhaerens TaxID=76935 RepID=A0A9Q4FYE3_SALAG|nr:acetyltransferase [Salipaludibacillus agaradhaerens]MCR6096271.1 acetyltransferase [Salipaludibacillus agaradhaerens]MCR6114170.1 acetyltransferase [Salipaludibacillus agaradhaerens]
MNLIIVGYGGHSKVLTDIAQRSKNVRVIGYLDDKFDGMTIDNGVFYAPLSFSIPLHLKFKDVKWLIGVGDNIIRKKIVKQLKLPREAYMTLVHPTAEVSPHATVGPGTVVMPHAVINADSTVGAHVIVNSGAIIEHDNIINDYVHLSPHATLTGNVEVKEGTHLGANATVIPGKTVGEWSVIGAGSTVIHSMPSFITAAGVPATVKAKAGEKIVKYNV